MNKENEVWEVEIRSEEYEHDVRTLRVFAHSAGEAEKKAISLVKKDDKDFEKPYCRSASFLFYIAG